ncbi:adenosine deaminase [Microbacterium sp. 22215]|uniref:adenosine deaminase n=1 Tax=Microbacterium sp. 22215 TaxID=3453893 RepID=UPI003F867887
MINLHTHLEGRVRPQTALELAVKLGLRDADRDWEAALQLDAPSDLTVYLEKVSSTYPFFSDYDALARISREAVEDAAADGEDYLELRFGPASHMNSNLDLDGVIAAVCEGVAQGTQSSAMPAGVVVAALRLHDAELNESVARAATRFAGKGVVGFDLAGDELRFPDLEPYVNAFAIARNAGLGLTCHAAEAAPAQAAVDAIRLFGVTRIGHGAYIAQDERALAKMADEGIFIEVCPSSNLYTGAISSLHAHPAPIFRDAGVGVVLGDDNPRQTGSLLSGERRVLSEELGFDAAALAQLDADSVKAAFVDESTRAELAARLSAVA